MFTLLMLKKISIVASSSIEELPSICDLRWFSKGNIMNTAIRLTSSISDLLNHLLECIILVYSLFLLAWGYSDCIDYNFSFIAEDFELVLDASEFGLLFGTPWLCFPSYVVIKALGSSVVPSTNFHTLHLGLMHL